MVRSTHPINTPTYLRLRDQIRSDIEDGCWRLGQHLTLHELSAHYSVSNVPVREALLQLQGDGMVDMRMNKGAVVRAVDARFIDEYFDVREALQSMLLARACRTMGAGSAQTLSGVNALLGPLEDATRAGRVRELLAADEALQDHLGRLGGNDQALGMQASRGRLLEAFRRARWRCGRRNSRSWPRRDARCCRRSCTPIPPSPTRRCAATWRRRAPTCCGC